MSLVFLAPDSLQVFQVDLVPFWLPPVLRVLFWVRSRGPTACSRARLASAVFSAKSSDGGVQLPVSSSIFFSAESSPACPCFLISFSCSSIRWRRQCGALLFSPGSSGAARFPLLPKVPDFFPTLGF
jgi:hypothetical protein